MEDEIWKDIKEYEGLYQISNYGNIKSKDKYINHNYPGFKRLIKGRNIKKNKNNIGYYCVGLHFNRKVKLAKIHRLVAEHFIENQENKPCVNHKDGNKLNNHVDNLEWVTYKENNNHALISGLNNIYGQNNGNSRLKNNQVISIKKLIKNGKLTFREIARQYNCNADTITKIKKGKSWAWL